MPPRKRARTNTAASAASTPVETQPKTPIEPPAVQQSDVTEEDLLNDPWTDEQETVLFSSMIKWKPTGPLKHFHMLSIFNSLHPGYPPNVPLPHTAQHTRIPGIWAKLHKLYDLDALDERELQHFAQAYPDAQELPFPKNSGEADNDEDEEMQDADEDDEPVDSDDLVEFQLPEDDFSQMMWERRFPDDDAGDDEKSSGSSPLLPELLSQKTDPAPPWDVPTPPTRETPDEDEEDEEDEEEDESVDETPQPKSKSTKKDVSKTATRRGTRRK